MFFRKKREKEKPPRGDSFDDDASRADATPSAPRAREAASPHSGRDLDDPTIARSVTRPGASKASPSSPRRVEEEIGEDATQFIGAPAAYGATLVAWLVHAAGANRGRDVRLASGLTRVGSSRDCDLPLAGDSYVSSKHAELVLERGLARVRDLGSTNGTYVNGERITEAELADGDRVRFGTTELVFKCVHL